MKKLILLALLFMSCLNHISVQAQSDPINEVDQILQTLDNGGSVENMIINLGDINFELGRYELTTQAKVYLDKVTELLFAADNIELIIKGHTDNTGSHSINQKLSQDRAASVQDYLILRGIKYDRLSSKGFGSSQPLDINDTELGRSKNRRVELEVIRNKTVERIQDIILLRDGSKIGAIILSYDKGQIRYKGFSTNEEYVISTKNVQEIQFADGRVVKYQVQQPKVVKETFVFQDWWKKNSRKYIKTPQQFSKGESSIQLTYNLRSTLGTDYKLATMKTIVPPITVAYEKGITKHLGLVTSVGMERWKDPMLNCQFNYLVVGAKANIHFHLHPKLATYIGLGFSHRRVSFKLHDIHIKTNSITRFETTIGLRYYLNKNIGFIGEIGSDSMGWYKAGLVVRIPSKTSSLSNSLESIK